MRSLENEITVAPLPEKTLQAVRDHQKNRFADLRNAASRHWLFKVLKNMGCGRLVIREAGKQVFETRQRQDGLEVELEVRDQAFYSLCVAYGDIGFGEAYERGFWETNDLTKLIAWFIANIDHAPTLSGSKRKGWTNWLGWINLVGHWSRHNSRTNSRTNIHKHYDLGNEFYKLFLDRGMTYSSALFSSPHQTLEEAQTEKYERLCKVLKLAPSDEVLEVGCGWGGFAEYAARNYGCRITGVTLSNQQYLYCQKRMVESGLKDRVKILLQDYRDVGGRFDKVVSIEMLEAVGDRYLEVFFQQCNQWLKRNGLLALQFITCPDSRFDQLRSRVDWIQKHIFPGSLLLSLTRVQKAVNQSSDLSLHDLKDIGCSYSMTLKKWRDSFIESLPLARDMGFDDAFIRRWDYYLSYCRAAFSMKNISAVQAVYTRPNNRLLRVEPD